MANHTFLCIDAHTCGNPVRSASGFCFPDSVASDPAGNLWISESGGNRVVVFDD